MSISYRSGSYTESGISSCNATLPAGVQNGDLLIALIATDSATPQGASGFTQRGSGSNSVSRLLRLRGCTVNRSDQQKLVAAFDIGPGRQFLLLHVTNSNRQMFKSRPRLVVHQMASPRGFEPRLPP